MFKCKCEYLNIILLFILMYTDHNGCILKLRGAYIIKKNCRGGW
jgi:hypothetical protein